MKVLFAEDNEVTAKSISGLLKKKGYQVVVAPEVQIALDIIAKEPRFTHLICDYSIEGESGLEVVEAFNKKFPHGHIMIFTGHEEFMQMAEVNEFFSRHIHMRSIVICYKPIDQNSFMQLFHESEKTQIPLMKSS